MIRKFGLMFLLTSSCLLQAMDNADYNSTNNSGCVKKAVIVSLIENQYNQEGCGICGKEGGDIFWFSPKSRTAHSACSNLLKNIEEDTSKKMNKMFDQYESIERRGLYHTSHKYLAGEVQEQCGNFTILEYFNEHGEDKVKSLFDNATVLAVYSTVREQRIGQQNF